MVHQKNLRYFPFMHQSLDNFFKWKGTINPKTRKDQDVSAPP